MVVERERESQRGEERRWTEVKERENKMEEERKMITVVGRRLSEGGGFERRERREKRKMKERVIVR